MQAFQQWLMRGSIARAAGVGVGVGTTIIGVGLQFRQNHLRNSPITEAAQQQLKSADAVRQLLGSNVASVSGFVGGYTDPLQGTAAITLPIVSEGGVHALARVEAEAEWVKAVVEAKARGEEPPTPVKAETCRWLLRHLEIELLDPPPNASASADGARPRSVTLYSLPAQLPLTAWAPSREPSRFPHWLRGLLPEPTAALDSEAWPRLVGVASISIALHFVAFLMLHRKMVAERALRRAESLLALPETPTIKALATRAMELAQAAKGEKAPITQQAGAVLYGKTTDKAIIGYTALSNRQELFFKAEKLEPTRGGVRRADWMITHVAVENSAIYAGRLAKLPETADAETMLESLASVPGVQPLDLGTFDRRVKAVK